MIKIKTTDETNMIEIEVDGKVSENDVKDFKDYVDQKKKDLGELNLLVEIKNLGYTLDGLKEEIKFDIKHLDKFDKIAVLSEKKWIDLCTQLTKALPNVEVKHFDSEEKEKALYWLR